MRFGCAQRNKPTPLLDGRPKGPCDGFATDAASAAVHGRSCRTGRSLQRGPKRDPGRGCGQSPTDVSDQVSLLTATAGNDEERRQLDPCQPGTLAVQSSEQLRREGRRPAATPMRVPDRPGAPREQTEHGESDTVAIASLAATRPRYRPRTPARHPSERRTEAPANPPGDAEQPEHADYVSERARGGDRNRDSMKHASSNSSRMGQKRHVREWRLTRG
jgi:hypothetical protein